MISFKKKLKYFFKTFQWTTGDKGKEYGSCIFVFKVVFKAKPLMHGDHWLHFVSCRARIRLYVLVCQIWALITYAFMCTLRCFYEKQSQNPIQKELNQIISLFLGRLLICVKESQIWSLSAFRCFKRTNFFSLSSP